MPRAKAKTGGRKGKSRKRTFYGCRRKPKHTSTGRFKKERKR